MRPVCVIGLGLIGGSVLRAARAGGREVWGATKSAEDAGAASAEGFDVGTDTDDAVRRAAERDALIVVAVPLPGVPGVLARVTELAPDCLVTDVVSVKGPVVDAAAGLRYAGGHPMAGRSRSGWAASDATLFADAAWVVTAEEDTETDAWLAAAQLALDCGAHVVPTTADEHDAAVARVSHLPHVLAAVLAAVGADGGPLAMALAAGSFGDGTRVAGSRPELVRAMCEGNRPWLLSAVDDALGKLGTARGALASTGSLGATIDAGHRGHTALTEHRDAERVPVRIDLAAPDALEALRTLGARGGRVIEVSGSIASADIPRSRLDNES